MGSREVPGRRIQRARAVSWGVMQVHYVDHGGGLLIMGMCQNLQIMHLKCGQLIYTSTKLLKLETPERSHIVQFN